MTLRLAARAAAISAAMLLTALGGCGGAPQLFLQGELLGAAGGAKAGQPLPGVRVHYRLALELDDGTERSLDYWPETDEQGLFFVDEDGLEEIQKRVVSTHARVTLQASPASDDDWSEAVEIEAPEQGGSGAPITRNDRFTLKAPFSSVAVRVTSMRDGAQATAEQYPSATAIHGASLILNQCGIALVATEYQAIDPTADAPLHPRNYSQLAKIRLATGSNDRLTIAITGLWDRSGDLAGDDSWAYGSMPAPPPAAPGVAVVVAESRALEHPALLAHEIAHTLNLLHVDDPSTDQVDDTTVESVGSSPASGTNLMFHQIDEKNWRLTPGQCARVRKALAELRGDWARPWENGGT